MLDRLAGDTFQPASYTYPGFPLPENEAVMGQGKFHTIT
jgi:hypothetical protein